MLQGRGFAPARRRAGIAAEMPAMPRCVADVRYGRQLLGCRGRLGARAARDVLGRSPGARRGAGDSASRAGFVKKAFV
jgi:hypothetical protein